MAGNAEDGAQGKQRHCRIALSALPSPAMNTPLAIALIALALAAGFLGGMAVAKQEVPAVAAAGPTKEQLIASCYQAQFWGAVQQCLKHFDN